MAITEVDLGSVRGTSFRFKKAWMADTAYANDKESIDVVTYQGNMYGCLKSHISSATVTPSNTTYWQVLAEKGDPGVAGENTTISFQMAAQRAGIQSGDSLGTALGKLAKFCDDVLPHAFVAPVNNLAGTNAAYPLAAPMGKQLKSEIDALNSSLVSKKILFESESGVQDGDTGILSEATWDYKFFVAKLLGTNIFIVLASPYLKSTHNLYGGTNFISGNATMNTYAVNILMEENGKNFTVEYVKKMVSNTSGNTFSSLGDLKIHRIYGFK